jgi:Immunoglobulin I-set domain
VNDDDDSYLQDKSETDDYEEDDFDDSDDKKKGPTSSSVQPEEPYKTQTYTEKADVGRTVTLKCLDENIATSHVIMWFNETLLLAQGETLLTKDKRISFTKDGTMVIRDVNSFDNAEFRCRSFSGKERHETKIQLNINGPPRGITIGHNVNTQSNIADMTLDYKAGRADLRFKCKAAKGRPQPKINWVHNGNTILESANDPDLRIEDEGVLIIKHLHARHAGEYQCEASNEFGNLKASFKINVECKFLHPSLNFKSKNN